MVDREGLWYRVLKARYGEVGGCIREGDRYASVWWKMICRVREGVGRWFDENIRRVVGDGRNTFFWYDNWIWDIPLRFKFSRLFDLTVDKECKVEEMWRLGWAGDGRAWVWRRRLFAWEGDSVRECAVLLNNIVLQDNVHDSWRWLLDLAHRYSVKAAYRYITTTGENTDRSQVADVWVKHIPSKVSIMVWRLLCNRLPTRDNLVHQGILLPTDGMYVAGCDVLESATHLFLHCDISSELWSSVRSWLGIYSVPSGELRHHFTQFTKMAGMPISSYLFLTVIWFATVWVIWKEQNNRVFQNATATTYFLLEKVKLNSFLWLKSKQSALVYSYTTGENTRCFVWVCFSFFSWLVL